MRYLAVDLGDKRTGIAAGDDDTGLVDPVTVLVIPRGEALGTAILKQAQLYDADALVIGLPLNMDDTEGPQAKLVRAFGDDLAAKFDGPLYYQDERLTSYAANQQMARSGRTRGQKKKLRDALAAAEILRDFLAVK